MYAVGGFTSSEKERCRMFTGNMDRLLTPSERLSLKCETESSIWVSTDATLAWIGGIAWNGRKFPRGKIGDIGKILGLQLAIDWWIGACEMIAAAVEIMISPLYPWGEKIHNLAHG